MTTQYTITAGDNSTDLSCVGTARTTAAAKRIGRDTVRACLPNGEGTYKVIDEDGREVFTGERSMRTDRKWVERN